jgi:hypothetical protein
MPEGPFDQLARLGEMADRLDRVAALAREAQIAEVGRLIQAGVDAREVGAHLQISRSGVYKLLSRAGFGVRPTRRLAQGDSHDDPSGDVGTSQGDSQD